MTLALSQRALGRKGQISKRQFETYTSFFQVSWMVCPGNPLRNKTLGAVTLLVFYERPVLERLRTYWTV